MQKLSASHTETLSELVRPEISADFPTVLNETEGGLRQYSWSGYSVGVLWSFTFFEMIHLHNHSEFSTFKLFYICRDLPRTTTHHPM